MGHAREVDRQPAMPGSSARPERRGARAARALATTVAFAVLLVAAGALMWFLIVEPWADALRALGHAASVTAGGPR